MDRYLMNNYKKYVKTTSAEGFADKEVLTVFFVDKRKIRACFPEVPVSNFIDKHIPYKYIESEFEFRGSKTTHAVHYEQKVAEDKDYEYKIKFNSNGEIIDSYKEKKEKYKIIECNNIVSGKPSGVVIVERTGGEFNLIHKKINIFYGKRLQIDIKEYVYNDSGNTIGVKYRTYFEKENEDGFEISQVLSKSLSFKHTDMDPLKPFPQTTDEVLSYKIDPNESEKIESIRTDVYIDRNTIVETKDVITKEFKKNKVYTTINNLTYDEKDRICRNERALNKIIRGDDILNKVNITSEVFDTYEFYDD